ncbi:2387_t:CDS:2, partial [Scutellospora calospora]
MEIHAKQLNLDTGEACGIVEVEENNNFSWNPDTEINERKESVSKGNTDINLISPEEMETKAKTTEKEDLELLNEPIKVDSGGVLAKTKSQEPRKP